MLIFVQTSTDKLSSLVVRGSFHNSGERFDAPKCSEDTRVAIVNDILTWLDDVAGPCPVLWMNGAAGAGKTAIAQTIAKLLYEQGRLAASFFYSRTAADADRRNDFKVIPTLVYQLMRNIPESGQHIYAALANDEFLFDLTLGTQLERLIVAPLLLCSERSDAMSAPHLPKIIVIDGLDESSSTKDKQKHFNRTFVEAFIQISVASNNRLPVKLLIASRPEQHILSLPSPSRSLQGRYQFFDFGFASRCRRRYT